MNHDLSHEFDDDLEILSVTNQGHSVTEELDSPEQTIDGSTYQGNDDDDNGYNNAQNTPKAPSANFLFKCMVGFLAAGALLLVIALLLTCPGIPAAIGLTTGSGLTANMAIKGTFIASGFSLLAAGASFFGYRQHDVVKQISTNQLSYLL
jgi:hypothetical protein